MRHRHWVTVIETDTPEVYDGPRVAVFHSLEKAQRDVVDWILNYYDEDDGNADYTSLVVRYRWSEGRQVKIEEC
jgi:hypothetical protein